MIDTACNMLDAVYNRQYERVTNYINDCIKSKACSNLVNCRIPHSNWRTEYPLVDVNEVMNELELKGYKVVEELGGLTINWEGVERNCMRRPFAVHSQVKIGNTDVNKR